MRKYIAIAVLLTCISLSYGQTFKVYFGSNTPAYEYIPTSAGGLAGVYVIQTVLNARIEFESSSADPVTWYSFEKTGVSISKKPLNITGNTLNDIVGDKGYIARQGDKDYAVWVVNYSDYPLQIYINGGSCDYLSLSGFGLPYYTESGRMQYVPRDFSITHNTIVFTNEPLSANTESVTIMQHITADDVTLNPPLCNTTYTISGDNILQSWGQKEQVFTTEEYRAIAVKGRASVVQNNREVLNEVNAKPEDGGLGGSAPAEIEFHSVMNSPVASYVAWEFADNEKFDPISARYTDANINYTFKNEGTTYIKLIVTNTDNSCSWDSTFTVTIGASRLEAPNFFTPGSSSGSNLEWRVAYSSIVSFQCWIFNRWGIKMYESTDPASGWNGKYGGKYVPSGVYFYVVEAKGSDGKNYKLKGDINILRSRD